MLKGCRGLVGDYVHYPSLPATMDMATICSSVGAGLANCRVPQPLYPEPVMTPPPQNVGAPSMRVVLTLYMVTPTENLFRPKLTPLTRKTCKM